MIEHRECIIYEIVGRKVGQTRKLGRRMKQQHLVDDETYHILQVIPANTMTIREIWELEQKWANKLGYEPENEGQWQFLEQTLLDIRGPEKRAKAIANTDQKAKRLSQSKTFQDPNWKSTVGVERIRKIQANIDFEKMSKSISKTKADPEWKKKQIRICPECGIETTAHMYSRHVGSKTCKNNQKGN